MLKIESKFTHKLAILSFGTKLKQHIIPAPPKKKEKLKIQDGETEEIQKPGNKDKLI